MSLQAEIIKDLRLWIESNLENDLVIDAVSSKSGFSKWHLQRIFVQETGIPIGRYIRNRRLQLASEELAVTKNTISDIPLKYGFSNQQAFTRTFTRHFRMPPGQWREVKSKIFDVHQSGTYSFNESL